MAVPAHINIFGSATILSDIDVTIESTSASAIIKFIEDLWERIAWFDNTAWRVDLYGDFTMIGDISFMNVTEFHEKYRQTLVIYAIASYLRQPGSHAFDVRLVEKIVRFAGYDYTQCREIAEGILGTQVSPNEKRQAYYSILGSAEQLHRDIINEKIPITQDTVGNLFIKLCEANLYREENYILPSTVIHIVKIEQAGNTSVESCPSGEILTRIANCSLDNFAYLLSAVEQLGYMQANLDNYAKCTIPAIKYFGRCIRALGSAGIKLSEGILTLSAELAEERLAKTAAGIVSIECDRPDLDLYEILLGEFQKQSGAGRKTRKRRRHNIARK